MSQCQTPTRSHASKIRWPVQVWQPTKPHSRRWTSTQSYWAHTSSVQLPWKQQAHGSGREGVYFITARDSESSGHLTALIRSWYGEQTYRAWQTSHSNSGRLQFSCCVALDIMVYMIHSHRTATGAVTFLPHTRRHLVVKLRHKAWLQSLAGLCTRGHFVFRGYYGSNNKYK